MNQPISPSDERTWSMLAHLSSLLNLILPGLGGVAGAGIIWMIYKEKSKKVEFHSLQSLVFQIAVLVAVLVVVVIPWVVGFIISFATAGFGTIVAVPIMILVFFLGFGILLAGLIYSLYAAYAVNKGEDFRYKWIGDWVFHKVSPAA
jgi:uncharacterized Tic20 family protein